MLQQQGEQEEEQLLAVADLGCSYQDGTQKLFPAFLNLNNWCCKDLEMRWGRRPMNTE